MKCPVREAALRAPDAPALQWNDEVWSYRTFDDLIEHSALALKKQGVVAGQRVPMQAPNGPELVVMFHALGRLGAVLVPLNTHWNTEEIDRAMAQVPSTPPKPGARVGLFTSGTTGVPKLIEITEENLQASASASGKNLGSHASQRWLGTLPLFHIGGLAMVHRCAVYGACLVLERGFDVQRVVTLMDSVTHASLVPTTLERLLDARGDRAFVGVEAVLIGGGPMTSTLLARARRMGLPVLQTYGLTEATSQVTTERLSEADGLSAGHPIDGVEVRIVDDVGAVVAAGTPGLIEVRGATVTVDGWLATKDIGSLDARGRLTLLSRRVDLIITGGENVYPLEVEAVVREHPAIADVAIVPKPDAQWGQVPVGFAVLKSPLTEAELTAWLRGHVAHYKAPKIWKFLEKLPRNAMGKLDRNALAAQA